MAIAVLVLAGAAGVVVRSLDDGGPSHPDEWDPRVAHLAAFVEEARGLDFRHPVHVDFLTPEEYRSESTSDEGLLTDADREDLELYAGSLRAVGLATGEVDLFTAYNQVSDSGTLAFYRPDDDRVRVRGTEITVGLEITIVHELVHALQDQHFELERLYAADLDSSAELALRALIEGDAMRIEEMYVDSELSDEEEAAYDDEMSAAFDASEEATSEVPAFISASFGVPYLLGHPLVLMLAEEGGNDRIDDAFEDPPSTEEHLFDPASFLAGEGAEDVRLDLDDGLDVLDEGPFGSPTWYLMLAERIDPKVALDAALGWAGDAFATFERDGRACMRAVFAGDHPEDEEAMATALEHWLAAMPGDAAELIEIDGRPGFDSCDPGADIDMQLTDRARTAMVMPSLWAYLVASSAEVLDADGTRCYARHVIEELSFEEITSLAETSPDDDGFQRLLFQAFETCA